jgi:hypothetical protein
LFAHEEFEHGTGLELKDTTHNGTETATIMPPQIPTSLRAIGRNVKQSRARGRPIDDRTRVVEIPDIGRLRLEGGRAVESSETAGKSKQRIEDGFFHGDGFVVN